MKDRALDKNGYRGITLYLKLVLIRVGICVEWRGEEQSPISLSRSSSEIAIAIAFVWCVALEKIPGTFFKKIAALMIHRAVVFL